MPHWEQNAVALGAMGLVAQCSDSEAAATFHHLHPCLLTSQRAGGASCTSVKLWLGAQLPLDSHLGARHDGRMLEYVRCSLDSDGEMRLQSRLARSLLKRLHSRNQHAPVISFC